MIAPDATQLVELSCVGRYHAFIFDEKLALPDHISACSVCQSYCSHICYIIFFKINLYSQDAQLILHPKRDYCNSLYYNIINS